MRTSRLVCHVVRVGLMRKTSKDWNFWVTLTFTQGHRIIEKLELVQNFTVFWSSSRQSNVCDCLLCNGVDFKEILQVWWIWISWTFALLLFCSDSFLFLTHLEKKFSFFDWNICRNSSKYLNHIDLQTQLKNQLWKNLFVIWKASSINLMVSVNKMHATWILSKLTA